MKNKNKKVIFYLILFLNIGFFGFSAESKTSNIIISAIQTSGEETDNDFVELYNPTCSSVDIAGWKLRKRTSSGSEDSFRVFKNGSLITAKGYFLWANLREDFDKKIKADDSTQSILSSNYSLALFGKSDNAIPIDSITWGTNADPFSPTFLFPRNPLKKEALLKNDEGKISASFEYVPKNAAFINKAELDKCPAEEPKIYSNKIIINEILPNPKGKDDGAEFIEFYNSSNADEDLDGWKLKNEKGSVYKIKKSIDDLTIKALDFLAIDPDDYGMSLNNKDGGSIELIDPNGRRGDFISYPGGAKDNLCFSLDGSRWRWTSILTRGFKNSFEDEPDFKIEKDKDIYKNFPANFKVKIKHYKKNKTKITWDFGDGHKSYKQKTTHKYEKKGKYSGSVKVSNGSEDVIKTFKIEVKNFPKYDIEIIEVNANPDGKDSDFETITVKNNSKKKINLQNWSIATGDKKLINHPIASKITLKPKEILKITRDISKFTLNNKKAQVELRYPNGKVASKMAYGKKSESIAEGEILEKSKLGWVWKNTLPAVDVSSSFAEASEDRRETSLLAVAPETGENLEVPQILGESAIKEEMWGGQSEGSPKKDYRIFFAGIVYGSTFNQAEKNNQSRIESDLDLASLFF